MKQKNNIPLQLVTIRLEDGQQGIFIGLPLTQSNIQNSNSYDKSFVNINFQNNQVSELWFSNVREVPTQTSLHELFEMVQAQLCRCNGSLH